MIDMEINRIWAMPNSRTFQIKPIRELIDNIDLIENCVMKQKAIPVKPEKHFKLFGKMEWIK